MWQRHGKTLANEMMFLKGLKGVLEDGPFRTGPQCIKKLLEVAGRLALDSDKTGSG
jgi:hypothetical protein